MRKFAQKICFYLAKLILLRYRPKLVAITGSVGKTSTKEAVAKVLLSKYSVRASLENYNNELGVPLTVLDEKSPGKNILGWILLVIKTLFKFVYSSYPDVLVLELGTDRPGDLRYLTRLLGRVDVGVITDIGISHLEFFAHPQELAKEKLSLIKLLPTDATAVLNFDNQKIYDGKNQTRAQIIGYGFHQHTNLTISDFQVIDAEGSIGVNFKVHHRGHVVPFFLPSSLGKPMAYAATAAAAVGLTLNVDLSSASEALRSFNPPPGRLRLLEGIKRTRIIDDTYNAAPDSTFAALEALHSIAHSRKLTAIGDMAELGSKSDSGHREVAAKIVESAVDVVFLVGTKTKIIKDELTKRKFAGKVNWYQNSDDARMPIQNALVEGDTILIKGSQSMRMEKIVKEIMADPEHAGDLLVRQSEKWLNKP